MRFHIHWKVTKCEVRAGKQKNCGLEEMVRKLIPPPNHRLDRVLCIRRMLGRLLAGTLVLAIPWIPPRVAQKAMESAAAVVVKLVPHSVPPISELTECLACTRCTIPVRKLPVLAPFLQPGD